MNFKVITKQEELDKEFLKIEFLPISTDNKNYGDVEYECACGQKHKIRFMLKVACAKDSRFLLRCGASYFTFIEITGFIFKEALPKWSFDNSLIIAAIMNLPIPNAKKKEIFHSAYTLMLK
jgi:hypothetical protein